MMKTFDDLIYYLLEEIALCGEQGAQISDIVYHIQSFYAISSDPNLNNEPGTNHDIKNKYITVVDHSFQDQVWKWLVAHPDCRVEIRGEKYTTTLSAGEAVDCFPLPLIPQNRIRLNSGRNDSDGQPMNIELRSSSNGDCFISGSEICSEALQHQEVTNTSGQLSRPKRGVRIYTNEARMWHALTGHDVDFSKIPQLDFVCLSIIAAAGPGGILQSDLVRVSNQDKRSVPRRTQILHDHGYIIKRPILTGGSRTSLCILKRFVQAPSNEEKKHVSPKENLTPASNDSETIFKQCFQNGTVDLCALSRAIFDILSGLKIIMLDDLKANLGVIGHRWERRVVAMTLRKLEALECVKQVKAQDDSLGLTSKYFRCVKFIREPGEKESQLLFGLANVNMRPVSTDVVEELDSEGDFIEDDKSEKPTSSRFANDSKQLQKPQKVERPIPQWSGAGCINNTLYDIVHGSGTKGISTMDIKNQLLGKFVLRPIEHQLSRIVDFWQISQPSHLRHLAILRDVAMVNKNSHYVHFSYDNFKKLVDGGEASWEAITTFGKNEKKGREPAPAFDDEPNKDEYGFPILQSTLFQGPDKDATPAQCVQALNAKPLLLNRNDPIACKLNNGTYGVRGLAKKQDFESHKHTPKTLNEMPKMPRPKGRPPKVKSTRATIKSALVEKRSRTKSRHADVQYPKTGLRNEITNQIHEPGDSDYIMQDLSTEFIVEAAKVREQNSRRNGNYINPHDMVVENQDIQTIPSSPSNLKRKRCSSHSGASDELIVEYIPSTIAHSLPIFNIPDSPLGNTSPKVKHAVSYSSNEHQVENGLGIISKPFRSIEYQYLPSVAAHSKLVLDESDPTPGHSTCITKRALRRPFKKFQLGEESTKVSHAGELNKRRELTYEEQSHIIKRADHGVFIGNNALRARYRGQRGRSKNCRLAIFKSVRLNDFEWFKKTEPSSRDEHPMNVRDETRILPSIENPNPNTTSEVEHSQDHVSPWGYPHLLPEPNSTLQSPNPNYISPYSNSVIKKQKRIETPINVTKRRLSQNASVRSKASDETNSENSRYLAKASNENPQTLQNNETCNSYLGPPLSTSSFTPVNQTAIQKQLNSRATKRGLNAEICETEDSYSNDSNGSLSSPILDEVDPSMQGLVMFSHEPISTTENTLASNNDCLSPVADAVAPRSGTIGLPGITLKRKPEKRLSQALQSVSTTRGSIGLLRRNIIMDIIDICGGVFPGHKELVAPFISQWMKMNKPGKPDGKTVHAAYRLLVNSGKIRELKFSFQDSNGLMVTKSLTTKVEIDPIDAKVKKLQQDIIACYPQYFIPRIIEVSDEARQRAYFPSKWITNRSPAGLEVDNETQLRLQHKPGFVVRMETKKATIEKNRKLRGTRERKIERPKAKRKKHIETTVPSENHDIETFQYQGRFRARRVERLATLKRSTNRDILDLTMPPMAGLRESFLNQGDIAEIDLRSANPVCFSEADELVLANLKDFNEGDTISIVRKRPHQHSGVFEIPWSPYPRQIKRRKTVNNHCKELELMLSIMNPKHLFHPSSGTFSATFPGFEPSEQGLESKSRKKQVKGNRTRIPFTALRHSTIMDPTHVFHPASGTFSVMYSGLESFQRVPPGPLRRTKTKEDYTRFTTQRIPIFISQKHIFHPPSGTFSVIFMGFEFQHQDSTNKFRKTDEKGTKTAFEIEIDDLMSWGPMTEKYLSSDYSNWPFINYRIKNYHGVPSQTEYRLDTRFEVPLPETNGTGFSVFPRASVIKKHMKYTERASQKAIQGNFKRKRARTRLEFKTRPLTSRTSIDDIGAQYVSELADQHNDDRRPTNVRRIRGPHKQTPLTLDEEERLLAAVVVIRTLLGGVDKNVDWVLVTRLFQPAFSQMYIQKRWSQVQHRFRLQMDQIQANFQSKFAKAYEDRIIPAIDFDNIEEYDWAWLVDWTMENIDTSTDSVKHLPARRLDLNEIYDLRATSDNEMLEFFETDAPVVSQRREAVLNRRSYVYPSESKFQPSSQTHSDEIAIAKSWIRANVITSEANYDSKLARAKLSLVGESSIDTALQQLLEARLLMQQNKGRLVPGRNYDISDFFLSRMRKRLSASQFYQAASFKRKLDTELLAKGSAEFSYAAENGDLLAVLNMLAHKRISVRTKNPPMEKFGLIDGGYMTRRMDKSRLNFDVEIWMEPSYIIGNPLLPLQPPPRQHLEDPMAKIPVWYDIHDNFIPIMWEMALAATLNILSMRPGVTANEIERSIRPSLGAWELQMILEWLVEVKAGKKSGLGFMVDEWWWLCLGEGQMLAATEIEAQATGEKLGSGNLGVSHTPSNIDVEHF